MTSNAKGLSGKEIDAAYRLFLGRAPSEKERARMLAGQASYAGLRQTFLNSEEFALQYARRQAAVAARTPPALVHIHIPKTAGTSLAKALTGQPALQPARQVSTETLDDLRRMPRQQRRRLRYIHGHLSMGVGDTLDTPCRYLTVLRRPGPRIFSFYQFICRSKAHPAHETLTGRNMSFGDYLEYSVTDLAQRMEIDNGQIRRLAGDFDSGSLGDERRILATALHNALSPDMILGFVEHFDALLDRLVAEGFLPSREIQKRNISPNADHYDSAIAALLPGQKDIFDSYIAWDTYFYDVCEALLLPPGF